MTQTKDVCPKVETAFTIIGKKWNGLIVHTLSHDAMRFSELANTLTQLSDRVLTARLKELEQENILIREIVDGQGRYMLTEKGKALESAITRIGKWAEKYC